MFLRLNLKDLNHMLLLELIQTSELEQSTFENRTLTVILHNGTAKPVRNSKQSQPMRAGLFKKPKNHDRDLTQRERNRTWRSIFKIRP